MKYIVLRGSPCSGNSMYLRISSRYWYEPEYLFGIVGFRVVIQRKKSWNFVC